MSGIISDAERILSNTATMRRLGFAVDREKIIWHVGTTFSGWGTISVKELEERVKRSKFLQSESNW